jgi:NAD(P)-dependent dehydrogenase (short-subunit alcohol dehydrogenase family)
MPSERLKDRVAVITGAASGIGRAVAVLFARAGARVALLDVNREDGSALELELGPPARFYACDVSDRRDVRAAFDSVADELGFIDILINNAGISHVGTVETTSEAAFDRIYRVNVKGVYNCLQAAVRGMNGRGGAIVNMASTVSTIGIPERFAYSMSKGAVLAMTRSVACDYLDRNIRCNAIAPARIHTPFVDGFIAANYPGREDDMFERLSRTQPIGRMGRPEEVAALALYLCSDEAGFITGANFPIDGGTISLRP